MWPASMLAKSRTESEISRMNCEITSSGTISASSGLAPPRDPALEVAPHPVVADALDVGGAEGDRRAGVTLRLAVAA